MPLLPGTLLRKESHMFPFPAETYAERRQKLRQFFPAAEIEALLVNQEANRFYLTGFKGEGSLLVTEEGAFFFTDLRYTEEFRAANLGPVLVPYGPRPGSYLEALKDCLGCAPSIKRLGFEADFLTYAQAQKLKEKLELTLVPTANLVLSLRAQKTEEEISLLREAAALTCVAFGYLKDFLHSGLKEKEVVWELEYFLRRQGAERLAFEAVVVSGPRAAYPHGVPGERVLTQGDFVVLDFGAVKEGYSADFTRTVSIGKPTAEQRKIYDLVLRAQEKGLAAIRAGVSGGEVDATARRLIEAEGYGAYFGHSLGHGVGLEVHELPVLGPEKEEKLRAGMVVTVEPGVYLPGWGGVRIEDLVVVREKGAEILTPASKELPIIF